MICQRCKDEGKKSKVYSLGVSRTLMSFSPYWDENDVFHSHDPNSVREGFKCSNGHVLDRRIRNTCQCGWKQEIRDYIFPEGSEGHISYNKKLGAYTTLKATGKAVSLVHKLLTDDELVRYL